MTLFGGTCPVTHAAASFVAVDPSSDALPASAIAPSAAAPFPSSPASDEEAPEPVPPELAFDGAAAPELPEVVLERTPPLEELAYVAVVAGAPVSLPQAPSAPSARTTPSCVARDEPRRFMKAMRRP